MSIIRSQRRSPSLGNQSDNLRVDLLGGPPIEDSPRNIGELVAQIEHAFIGIELNEAVRPGFLRKRCMKVVEYGPANVDLPAPFGPAIIHIQEAMALARLG